MKKIISNIIYGVSFILLIPIAIGLSILLAYTFVLRVILEPILRIVSDYYSTPKWFDWVNVNIQNLAGKIYEG